MLDIAGYVAKDDPANAEVLLDDFEAGFELLCKRPGMGPPKDNIMPGLRMLLVRGYGVYYLQNASGIEILRVLHSRRDTHELF